MSGTAHVSEQVLKNERIITFLRDELVSMHKQVHALTQKAARQGDVITDIWEALTGIWAWYMSNKADIQRDLHADTLALLDRAMEDLRVAIRKGILDV